MKLPIQFTLDTKHKTKLNQAQIHAALYPLSGNPSFRHLLTTTIVFPKEKSQILSLYFSTIPEAKVVGDMVNWLAYMNSKKLLGHGLMIAHFEIFHEGILCTAQSLLTPPDLLGPRTNQILDATGKAINQLIPIIQKTTGKTLAELKKAARKKAEDENSDSTVVYPPTIKKHSVFAEQKVTEI